MVSDYWLKFISTILRLSRIDDHHSYPHTTRRSVGVQFSFPNWVFPIFLVHWNPIAECYCFFFYHYISYLNLLSVFVFYLNIRIRGRPIRWTLPEDFNQGFRVDTNLEGTDINAVDYSFVLDEVDLCTYNVYVYVSRLKIRSILNHKLITISASKSKQLGHRYDTSLFRQ